MRSERDLHELAGEFDTRNMESVIERLPDQIVFALSDPDFPTDRVPKGPYDKVVIAVLTDSEGTVKTLKKQGLPSEGLVSFFSNGKINNGAKGAK